MTLNRKMALRVVWGTRLDDDTPGPDARELLEMCGLVEPGAHVIAPDITGGIRVPTAGGPTGGNADEPPLRREPGEPPPRNVTTPPGLRVLPPPAAPAPAEALAPVKAFAPKRAPVKAGRVSSPPKERKRAAAAACGTTGGYARHVRLHEPVCQPCRDAKNAYWRDQHAARRVKKGLPAARSYAKVAACGTRSGYARHRRLGEEPCEPCRASNRRKTKTTKTTTSPELERLIEAAVLAAGPVTATAAPPTPAALPPRRLTAVPPPIAHGTAEGWQAHHDRGALPPCADCSTAAAPPPAPVPVKPDDWLAAAQRSPHRAVARAAATAIGLRVRIETATTAQLADGRLLARLDAALDDVARERARASSRTKAATP